MLEAIVQVGVDFRSRGNGVHKPERGIVGLPRVGCVPFTSIFVLGAQGKVREGDAGLQFGFQELRRNLL